MKEEKNQDLEILIVFNSLSKEANDNVVEKIKNWSEVEQFDYAEEKRKDQPLHLRFDRGVVIVKSEEQVVAVKDRLHKMSAVKAVLPPLKHIGLYD